MRPTISPLKVAYARRTGLAIAATAMMAVLAGAGSVRAEPRDWLSQEDLNLLTMWAWLVSPDTDSKSAEWIDFLSRQYTPDKIASEFAGLKEAPAANTALAQCLKRAAVLAEGRSRIDRHRFDLMTARAEMASAETAEGQASEALRKALQAWVAADVGPDSSALQPKLAQLKEDLNQARIVRLMRVADVRAREEALEKEVGEFRSSAAGEFSAFAIPQPSGSETPGALDARMSEHCARLKAWARHLRMAGSPAASSAAELPPAPSGTVFRLSGKVDQMPANEKVNKGRDKNDPIMTIDSGTITLTFIADDEPGPPGGHVEITPSTTLTYIYDYHHPHPNELVDRLSSACQLKGGRYVANPKGGVFPGLVGGFECDVTDTTTGKTPATARMSGGLRLDFRWDPYTSSNRWFLSFVGGPYGAEWRMN